MTAVATTWRCLYGRKQVRACKAEGGHCYVSDCLHGAWVPKGETTQHWGARVNREWLAARQKP